MLGWPDSNGKVSQPARPWTDLDEMSEGLIARHNEYVRSGDVVYHLGDMFWRTFPAYRAVGVIDRLNGQHYYILGNHEELVEATPNHELRNRFVWIKERAKIRPRKDLPSIVLDHYAARVWDGSHKGNIQLYGHSHGNLPDIGRQMDVGVDANNWYPVSLDSVMARIGTERIANAFTPRR